MKKTPLPSAARCRTRRSIISDKAKSIATRTAAILFWLCAWELLSRAVAQELLLVSPVKAVKTLWRMMGTGDFYRAVLFSFGKILTGFALGTIAALLLAWAGKASAFVKALLSPLMTAAKAMPVASFVILALVWIKADNLSVLIAFLMVLSVVYGNVLTGLENTSTELLEMARVFRMRRREQISAIYIPQAFPYFLAACRSALGMCWKAGVAAEVIGQPDGSIGDKLYRAKLFWSTDELFAWTLAIVLISVAFEKIALVFFARLSHLFGGGQAHD
ncbi:MAG: ABC transporter permease [Christensenellales bacterium]|jgi:NitT/TauT family transport system permease protein